MAKYEQTETNAPGGHHPAPEYSCVRSRRLAVQDEDKMTKLKNAAPGRG
ncbi:MULTISPECIES: hypothetical protein [Ensifer]|uniref:Uncharacterized protein n=1 Tax=Ensifer adhaerens TaxID=106592 RepID=A0ABY8HDE0_ENSAD|nr:MULTISPECIES: hypothetical protein [Ensifer]MBD9540175.1 hypothetical protein [Ensifer sp. ENS04]MDF8356019.1 hypothetical protein [Ensifer adhaerens]WFP90108.1 hypothetical protein P4B07_16340 [Ensifer adhaerens]